MTAAQAAFYRKLHANAATMIPDVARAYLAGIDALWERLNTRELNALIAGGAVERYISLALSDSNLAAAFSRYRAQIQLTAAGGVTYTARTMVGVAVADRNSIAIAFDRLSPDVVTALRALDSNVMQRLSVEVREVVRAILENGIRDGINPRQTSIAIRELIGIGKAQLGFVENLRAELETGKYADAARRALIDRRFNLAKLDAMTASERAARIDKIVSAYAKSFIAKNAATTATTATLQSFRAGQALSWRDAIDKGFVNGDNLMKKWIQVDRPTKREEHAVMAALPAVPFFETYTNGDMEPGDGDPWNCACSSYVYVGRGE